MNQAYEVYRRLDEISPPEIRFLDERDPFRFLISVILSAQTTDRIVNIVTKDLFARYPDAPSLAAADPKDVEEIVYPTGFYRNKAKNIIAASKALGDEAVPDTMEELIKLPGVGRKTASCILGDIYDKPAIIVDTHFGRVVQRLGITKEKDPTAIEPDVAGKLEGRYHYRFSMIVNLFGRTTCHAKRPQCETCLLTDICPSATSFLDRYARK
ncbi:MAG: endonuclease III [Spirochaetales bacterium]|nr:endonuclease III [Spirochaetales bacterium]